MSIDSDGAAVESARLELRVDHFFGDGWSASASVPTGQISVTPEGGGLPVRTSGFGDASLEVRYDLAELWGRTGGVGLTLSGGLALPTGDIAKTTPVDAAPVVVSLGTGVFNAFAGGVLTYVVAHDWILVAPISARFALGTSSSGMFVGPRLSLGLGMVYVASPTVQLGLSANSAWSAQTENEIEGVLINSGGTTIGAQASVNFALTERVRLRVSADVPFFADMNGEQLTTTVGVSAGLSVRFGGDADDDEPEATSGPSTIGTNDISVGGQRFDLADALVPGKYTIVDFWADWCAPCKVISARLKAITDDDERFVLRKAEVPDFESPVALQHLPGGDRLPVVRVYGPTGEKLADIVGGEPNEVLAAVIAVLPD